VVAKFPFYIKYKVAELGGTKILTPCKMEGWRIGCLPNSKPMPNEGLKNQSTT
jgi:hypothetical protein